MPAIVSSIGKIRVAEFELMVGLGRFGVGVGFVGLAILGGGSIPPALADSFYLKNGQVIEGTVLKSTLNTLTVQSTSGVRLTAINQIERVTLELADGSELSGELVSWEEGVFEIRSADQILRVAGGELLEDTAPAAPATETATVSTPVESVDEPSQTIGMAGLPSFVLKNGDTLVGKILHATGSVLTIRPEGGSALPISRAQIEQIVLTTADGEVISGKLLGWENGVYRVQLDDDRELLADLPDDAARAPSSTPAAGALPTVSALEAPVASEVEQADAAILPPPVDTEQTPVDADPPQPLEEFGVGGPANEVAIAGLTIEEENDDTDATAEADGLHLVETLVDAVDEDGETVVFTFQLDKPAVRPLVVLYAATEGSAKAGEDFEAKSGVITFATGSSQAEVQVPIIDDDQGEGSEKFNLFLSGDPETITFRERQIAVTINDND